MSAGRTALHCPSAVDGARRATRAFLEALGRPAICRAQADTVVLVVSEVVTNALRHGGGAYTLRLTAHPSCIEVAVEEPSPRMPRMRTPDLVDGTGGFGWQMINDLALTTVVTPGSNGGKRRTALPPPVVRRRGAALSPPARLRQLPAAIRGFVWRFHRRGSDQLCLGSRRPRRRASRSRARSRRPLAA
ncbi:ATP-binding protein [Streptomyces lavendulae]|uniref:ATP-binding protein n=1 Tax=Streptomyces lavendulae TaxID=1914 RepID=UPI0036A26B4D